MHAQLTRKMDGLKMERQLVQELVQQLGDLMAPLLPQVGNSM